MVSRLEAALSLAMLAVLICSFAGWDTALVVAFVPFVALGLAFIARIAWRRRQGQGWNEAWGRVPRDPQP